MELDKYAALYEAIESREDTRRLAMSDPSVSYNTLVSIYASKYQVEARTCVCVCGENLRSNTLC